MNSVRRSIKDTNNNKNQWRDKFRQQCTDRMKNARQEIVNKKREEQWIQIVLEKEWKRFKTENEEALRQEGITNLDDLIEAEDLDHQDEKFNFYLQQEQEEINNAIEQYQDSIYSVICVHCQRAYLTKSNLNNTPILSCPNCGFYATENCLSEIQKASSEHGSTCSGRIEFALEPGTDNTLIAICNICDLWTMFYISKMVNTLFSSNRKYLFQPSIDHIDDVKRRDTDYNICSSQLENIISKKEPISKSILNQLEYILKSNNEKKQTVLTVGFQLLDCLFPLLNDKDIQIQQASFDLIELLADQVDHDELVENMMDQLICISWEYNDEVQCYNISKLSSIFVEMFGRGLEKMTKARDWMLFLPFLSNYIVKVIDIIETILITKSMYNATSKKTPDLWEKTIILLTNNCLDFIEFIHEKTVAQTPAEFPLDTSDVGVENGDTKRRYLGYYLLNLVYEKIVANFDLQLSKLYFQEFHTKYTIQKPLQSNEKENFNNQDYKPIFDIVLRCSKIAVNYGYSFDRMYKLQNSLSEKDHHNISFEDRVSDDDRQMINSRMYPLSYIGIAVFAALSLYDKVLYPIIFQTSSIGNFPKDLSTFEFAKKYIGILLNLLTRSNEMVCEADKGVFVMLYLSDNINTKVTMNDMEKQIQGPCCGEAVFPAARIIEIISSVASTCPDSGIRFLSYKLIERFLNFGDDETRVFFLIELLDRCPYPTMRTAAIGLLKDQIDKSFSEKTFSIFKSPLIVKTFFPLIFKSNWKIETFWDDYSHIMQAINLYFYLLVKDEKNNLTTIWNKENILKMKETYFTPLLNMIQKLELNKENEFQDMQLNMIRDRVDKIMNKVSK